MSTWTILNLLVPKFQLLRNLVCTHTNIHIYNNWFSCSKWGWSTTIRFYTIFTYWMHSLSNQKLVTVDRITHNSKIRWFHCKMISIHEFEENCIKNQASCLKFPNIPKLESHRSFWWCTQMSTLGYNGLAEMYHLTY